MRPLSEEEIIQKATPIAHRVDDQVRILPFDVLLSE